MLEQPTAAAIRDELQRLVIADLHGPLGGETEEFGTEAPTDRYLLGRLAPDGTVVEPDDQDENPEASSTDPGDGQPEPSAPNITSLAPSALGCTAYVIGDTATLTVAAQWASYERVHSDSDSGPPMVWRRLPIRGRTTITLTEGELAPCSLHPDYPKVVVRGRALRHDGNWLVSMFIVNAQPRPSSLRDSAWLFQVELVLAGPDNAAVFLPRPNTVSGGDEADKAEQRRLAMAYRWCPEFATGHGVGVHVTPAADDPMRAVEIRTSAVPSYEVPSTGVPDPRTDPDLPLLADLVLDMKDLAEIGDEALIAGLTPLVAADRSPPHRCRGPQRVPVREPRHVPAARAHAGGGRAQQEPRVVPRPGDG